MQVGTNDRRGRLLSRIQRRYRTIDDRVMVGGVEVAFTRIEDPNRVLDEVAEREDRRERLEGVRRDGEELHLPYWAELWDSAAGIGQHLQSHHSPGGGRSAMDLGCGMGLSGLIAAKLGWSVLFADLEPDALLFAALNACSAPTHTRTRRLNWHRDQLHERFDLIIGSDILYERKQWEHLEPFWRGHLSPGGRIVLGEPGRITGDMFPIWVRERGWNLTESAEPVPTRPKPIRVFELSLPIAGGVSGRG